MCLVSGVWLRSYRLDRLKPPPLARHYLNPPPLARLHCLHLPLVLRLLLGSLLAPAFRCEHPPLMARGRCQLLGQWLVGLRVSSVGVCVCPGVVAAWRPFARCRRLLMYVVFEPCWCAPLVLRL